MAQILTVYLMANQPQSPPKKQTDWGAIATIIIALSPLYFSRKDESLNGVGAASANKGANSPSTSQDKVSIHINNSNLNTTNTVKQQDYSWVKRIVKQPFRMITGGQGSGKSTQERYWINLLKSEGWYIICLNPNTTSESWKGIEVIQEVEAIDRFLSDFPRWVERRQTDARSKGIDEDKYLKVVSEREGKEGRVAIFFMEANQFELKGVDPELWGLALKNSLTDVRKWGFTVCLTCQAGKQSTISSKLRGFSDNLKEAPQIECIATTNTDGDAVSSGFGLLKLPGQKPEKIALPNYPDSKDFRSDAQRQEKNFSSSDDSNQIKNGSQLGLIEPEDNTACNDSHALNQEFQAVKLGISKEAFLVLEKLRDCKEPIEAWKLANKRPFGGDSSNNPTSKVKDFLDELVQKELAQCSSKGKAKLYSTIQK